MSELSERQILLRHSEKVFYNPGYEFEAEVSDTSKNKSSYLLLRTKSPGETRKVGYLIGRLLEKGDIITLYGDLGSGKTCLIQGIASGAGVSEKYIASPTFIMINEYEGRIPFYHIDLYRIGASELEGVGFREYFSADGATAVEWAERAENELPDERLSIYFTISGMRSRRITLEPKGERYVNLIRQISDKLKESR